MSSFHGQTRPDLARIPQDLATKGYVDSLGSFFGSSAGTPGANNDHRYTSPLGNVFRAVESQVNAQMPSSFVIGFMAIKIQLNAKSDVSIINFVDDGVSVVSVSILAGLTGDFVTSSNVIVARDSLCNWDYDFTASSGPQTLTIRQNVLALGLIP